MVALKVAYSIVRRQQKTLWSEKRKTQNVYLFKHKYSVILQVYKYQYYLMSVAHQRIFNARLIFINISFIYKIVFNKLANTPFVYKTKRKIENKFWLW